MIINLVDVVLVERKAIKQATRAGALFNPGTVAPVLRVGEVNPHRHNGKR